MNIREKVKRVAELDLEIVAIEKHIALLNEQTKVYEKKLKVTEDDRKTIVAEVYRCWSTNLIPKQKIYLVVDGKNYLYTISSPNHHTLEEVCLIVEIPEEA